MNFTAQDAANLSARAGTAINYEEQLYEKVITAIKNVTAHGYYYCLVSVGEFPREARDKVKDTLIKAGFRVTFRMDADGYPDDWYIRWGHVKKESAGGN